MKPEDKETLWTRRALLRSGATGLGVLAAGALPGPWALLGSDDPNHPASKRLDLLILGGTRFLGPATVDAALARGHKITLFNRGRSNPHLYPDLEKIRGDRNKDLELLKGRRWDAVVDTCAYFPRQVRESGRILAENIDQYLLISSISVYKDFPAKDIDETSPVGRLEDPTVEKVTMETYGPLKALCEEAAESALPGKATNIRPGYIVGPRDRSDRFTYWPVRVARGGEMLAPGKPSHEVQFIDVRDLGEWIVHLIEARIVGVFNADGPPKSMLDLLSTSKKVSESDARFTWVDAAFLEKNEASLPIWIPPPEGRSETTKTRIEKAKAHGLRFRTLEDTVKATLAYHATRPTDYRLRAGLTSERETTLLSAWKARQEG